MVFNLERYKHLVRICALNYDVHDDDKKALEKMEEGLEKILKKYYGLLKALETEGYCDDVIYAVEKVLEE